MADRMNIKFTIQAVDRFSRNMDKLERKLDSLQRKSNEFDINKDVTITADTAKALNDLDTLNRRVDKLDREAKKKRTIKFKTQDADRELTRMSNIIRGMNPSEIDIDVNTKETFRQLRRVDDFMGDIRRKNRDIKVKLDLESGGAERSLARISNVMDGMGDKRLQIRGDNRDAMRSLRDVDTYMTDLQRNNRKIRTDFEIEIGGATRSLQRIARQTDKARNDARLNWPMHIETMQATNALRGLQRVVNRATQPREIDISVDLEGAISRLGAISSLATAIDRINPDIDVGADVAVAAAKLSLIQRLKQRVGRPVIVDVLVADYFKFRRNMDRIATTGRNVGEILGNTFMGVATTFSTTLVPIIASTVGAIGSLGVMIGTASGATMGLVSSFVGAGGAAAGFASVAIPTIGRLHESIDELDSLEEKVEMAKFHGNAKAAAKAQAELNKVLSEMSSEQLKARDALTAFKDEYNGLVTAMEGGVLEAYAGTLNFVTGLFDALTPMIEGSVEAVNNLVEAMNQNLEAEDVKAFFNFLNTDGSNALETIAKGLGNFLMGFLNLMTAFGPLSIDMQNGFLDMSERFREWTSALGENSKFQAFVDYTRRNWPLVKGIIGGAIAAIIETFAGFSGYAESWMATTKDLIDRWREFAQGMGENEKFQAFVDYMKTNGPLVTAMIGDMVGFLVALGVALAPVGSKMVEVASAIFEFLTNGLQANPVVGELIGWFISLSGAIFTLLPLAMAIVSFFSTLTSIGAKVIGFVKNLWDKFGSLAKIISKVKSGLETLYLIFLGLNTVVVIVVAAAALIIAAIVRMWRENERFREIITTVWEAIKLAITTVVEWISTTVTAVIGALVGWWEANQETFLSVAQTVWDTIYYAIETAIMWILETVMTIANKLADYWDAHGSTIIAIAKFAWEVISNTISDFMTVISAVIEVGLGIIKGTFEIVWPLISGIVKFAWELITSIIETAINVVMGIIDTVMNLIKGDWEAAWDSIKGIAEDIWQGIVGFFEDVDLYQIGANIIQGLIDGIGSMASAAWEAAKSIGSGITGAVTGVLGIKSPSRVFRALGEYTMMGMQDGIQSEAQRTINAVSRVADAMTKAFAPELSAHMAVTGGYGRNNAYADASTSYAQARAAQASTRAQESRTVVEVPVYLHGREIARASNDEQRRMNAREEARITQFRRTGGTQ